MKYTSPKLTPNKGRDSVLPPPPSPSPLCVVLDSPSPSPSLPFAPQDGAAADGDSELVRSDNHNATITTYYSTTTIERNDDVDDDAPRNSLEYSKIDDLESSVEETSNDTSQLLPLSTSASLVDVTLSSNNHSEHPVGNDDSGDGCVGYDAPDQVDDTTYAWSTVAADDVYVSNIDDDFDAMNTADRIGKDLSSIDLSGVHSLPESSGSHFGYHRSISMEPMLHALPAESNTTSGDETSSRMTSRELAHHDAQFALPWLDDDTNPTSPMVYDLSARPIASTTMTPGHDPICMGSPYSGTTESDFGGDAYFDNPCRRRNNNANRQRSDSIDEDSMLPPRVNRTTTNDYATHDISMPFLPGYPTVGESSSLSLTPSRMPMDSYPIPPPRQPFSHTHSLLDDCSDEDEDGASSFFIVDSPPRHAIHTYSCFPQSAGRRERIVEQKNHNIIGNSATGISNATLKASNNIQNALLQTRHRRWDCQSALAGPHAQSKEMLDISNRSYCVARYHPDNTDGVASSTRLSVSVEALQAAVLASGLWRTVRCVRLPQGLFWSQTYECTSNNDDIWALLKMLHSTFPMLNQIDFSGEIERASASRRNDIVAGIMECLPNIAAIDGFVVEQLVSGSDWQSVDKTTTKSGELGEEAPPQSPNNANSRNYSETSDIYNAAKACGECEPVPMCGLSELVGSEALNGILDAVPSDNDSYNDKSGMSNQSESLSVFEAESSLNVTGASSSFHAQHEDISEKNVSLEHVQFPTHHRAQSEPPIMTQDSSSRELSDDEVSKVPHISPSSLTLSSSLSWGSNGSVGRGSRPPTCPNSTSMNRQHPRLPTMPKGSSSMRKAGNMLKRRVLGLIPTVSIMDEDDDDEHSEGSDNSMDADRHADIL